MFIKSAATAFPIQHEHNPGIWRTPSKFLFFFFFPFSPFLRPPRQLWKEFKEEEICILSSLDAAVNVSGNLSGNLIGNRCFRWLKPPFDILCLFVCLFFIYLFFSSENKISSARKKEKVEHVKVGIKASLGWNSNTPWVFEHAEFGFTLGFLFPGFPFRIFHFTYLEMFFFFLLKSSGLGASTYLEIKENIF